MKADPDMKDLGIPSIVKIEISALIHATEDRKKVEKAVSTILPPKLSSIVNVKNLHGHYGNPIKLMTISIKSRENLSPLLKELITKLGSIDREILLKELPLHIAKNDTFYIRLNKQAAAKGITSLGEEDPIRIKVKFRRVPKKNDLIYKLVRMLENCGDIST